MMRPGRLDLKPIELIRHADLPGRSSPSPVRHTQRPCERSLRTARLISRSGRRKEPIAPHLSGPRSSSIFPAGSGLPPLHSPPWYQRAGRLPPAAASDRLPPPPAVDRPLRPHPSRPARHQPVSRDPPRAASSPGPAAPSRAATSRGRRRRRRPRHLPGPARRHLDPWPAAAPASCSYSPTSGTATSNEFRCDHLNENARGPGRSSLGTANASVLHGCIG